jgi:hypothetical protein
MRGGGKGGMIGDRLEIIGTQDEVAHRLRDRRIMAGELVKLPLHARVSLGLLAGTFDDQRQGGMKKRRFRQGWARGCWPERRPSSWAV